MKALKNDNNDYAIMDDELTGRHWDVYNENNEFLFGSTYDELLSIGFKY